MTDLSKCVEIACAELARRGITDFSTITSMRTVASIVLTTSYDFTTLNNLRLINATVQALLVHRPRLILAYKSDRFIKRINAYKAFYNAVELSDDRLLSSSYADYLKVLMVVVGIRVPLPEPQLFIGAARVDELRAAISKMIIGDIEKAPQFAINAVETVVEIVVSRVQDDAHVCRQAVTGGTIAVGGLVRNIVNAISTAPTWTFITHAMAMDTVTEWIVSVIQDEADMAPFDIDRD